MAPPSGEGEGVGAGAGRFAWGSAGLTADARAFYEEHGYVVLAGFGDAGAVSALRGGAAAILADPATAPPPGAVFTTVEQTRKMNDAHFLASAGAVACFREPLARDAAPRDAATNKIGHAMHDLVPAFARFSYGDRVRAVCAGLAMRSPVAVQSMYILKPPKIGGEVTPHRDATFVVVKDGAPLVVGLWMALQESHRGNGCLWAVPGSHRDGVSNRMVLDESRKATRFEGEEKASYPRERFVPLEMRPGDAVLLHGALLHMSLPNESATSRHAYSLHIVDGLENYSESGWLQRPTEFPFRALDDPPPAALA